MVLVQPCKTTAGFEAIPERDLRLDLARVRVWANGHGWSTMADAGVLLVLRKDLETTVFPSGKLLVKTRDRDAAQRVWDELSQGYGARLDGR